MYLHVMDENAVSLENKNSIRGGMALLHTVDPWKKHGLS